ncbi:MAG: TIGR04283 family arsenosugar biosynthesis glycosyltransferase [Proteobacteria bacterium]|nr:TIGR04283 family arsenosugar biosynthesis glycosyltransferase [Pseudomonadota bacterium]
MRLSIIIPVYNEALFLEKTLQRLQDLKPYEVIVIDGGSTDNTIDIAKKFNCKIINSPKGRGLQINKGIENAQGDIILVLHADTILSKEVTLKDFELKDNEIAGFFRLKYLSNNFFVKLVEIFANIRSKLHYLPYGDQAIFFKKEILRVIGGIKNYPFLEDLDLILRLRKAGKVKMINKEVLVSSRRIEKGGLFYPILHSLKNVFIVILFLAGFKPEKLIKFYK